MKRKILITVVLLNLGLLSAQWFVTSQRATDGDAVAEMEGKLKEISLENQRLKHDIYQLSSTQSILSRARESQLVPTKTTFYTPAPVASALTQQ